MLSSMFPKFRTPDVVERMHRSGRIAGRTEAEVDAILDDVECRYYKMLESLLQSEREEHARSKREIDKLTPIPLRLGMDVVKGQNYIYNDMMFIALQSMHIDESNLPTPPLG